MAVTALLGVVASTASAERFPEGPGRPGWTGALENQEQHLVIHCQKVTEEFYGTEFPKGTFKGVIVILPDGTFKDVSPDKFDCPLVS